MSTLPNVLRGGTTSPRAIPSTPTASSVPRTGDPINVNLSGGTSRGSAPVPVTQEAWQNLAPNLHGISPNSNPPAPTAPPPGIAPAQPGVDMTPPHHPIPQITQGNPYPQPPGNPYAPTTTQQPTSQFGAFSQNPFANWAPDGFQWSDNWDQDRGYLSQAGAMEVARLLGISPTSVGEYHGPMSQIYSSGALVGHNEGGSPWYYYDPTGQPGANVQSLSAFAPMLLAGDVDAARFLWDQRHNPLQGDLLAHYFGGGTTVESLQSVLDGRAAAQAQGFAQPQIPGVPQQPQQPGSPSPQQPQQPGANRSDIDNFIAMMQGLWQGVNPFTVQNAATTGNFGTPGAPFGQDYLDGFRTLQGIPNMGDALLSLLTQRDLFDLSPTGMYSQFGPASYWQRQLFPEFYI